MGKTKIEWCDITINPVVGCSRGCPYCYAKKINDRFKFVEDFSKPQFFPERLKEIDKIKNKVIFMNSMSDVSDWSIKELFSYLFNAMEMNYTNTYIYLTKNYASQSMKILASNVIGRNRTRATMIGSKYIKGLFGATICDDNSLLDFMNAYLTTHNFYNVLNIEPMLGHLDLLKHRDYLQNMKWVIIGAETGNRKNKVIPKREWIENILRDLKEIGYNGKIFMKNNLKKIYPDIELIQEFPFERSK